MMAQMGHFIEATVRKKAVEIHPAIIRHITYILRTLSLSLIEILPSMTDDLRLLLKYLMSRCSKNKNKIDLVLCSLIKWSEK